MARFTFWSQLAWVMLSFCVVAGVQAQVSWQAFSPPDSSFSIEVPGPAKLIDRIGSPGGSIRLWSASNGKSGNDMVVYEFGYEMLEGLGMKSDMELAEVLDGTVDGVLNAAHISEQSRQPLDFTQGYDVFGTMTMGSGPTLPTKMRFLMDRFNNRIYILGTVGSGPDVRFFNSFRHR